MFQPIDQSQILAGGMRLVPNLLEQELRKSLAGAQVQQSQTQARQEDRLSSEAGREVAEQEAFQRDLDAVVVNPSAAGYARLMAVYPRFSESMKRAWDVTDKSRRDSDFGQMAKMFSAGAADRWDMVEKQLQARVDADKESGDLDDADDAMLAMVKSGDAQQRRRALGMMGFHLSAIGGVERLAPTLDKIQPMVMGEDFEVYARSLGLEPGTAAYNAAVQDYVLKGQGPTAIGARERLEGMRQVGREELEGTRQGNRVALEGERQGNREALEDRREDNRRSRPTPDKPPSPTSVIGKIMAKQAAGQPLSPGEQKVWTDYQARQAKGRAGGPGRAGGAIIVNPQTGKRLQLVGGKWVPVK